MKSGRVGLYKRIDGGGPHRTSGSSPSGGRCTTVRHTEDRPELCSGSCGVTEATCGQSLPHSSRKLGHS